jgi:hypothetical protein
MLAIVLIIRDDNLFDSILDNLEVDGTSTFLIPMLAIVLIVRDINLFDSHACDLFDHPGRQPF